MTHWFRPLFALFVMAITVPAPAAAGAEGSRLTIMRDADGSLSAAIVDTPLDEVLAALSREAGATVIWVAPRSSARSTLSFHGLPPAEALVRLLSHYNFTLRFARNGTGASGLEVRIVSPIESPVSRPPHPGSTLSVLLAPRSFGRGAPGDAWPEVPGDGVQRVRVEAVRELVEREDGLPLDSPLRSILVRVDASDEPEVERVARLGLAALPDATLEAAAMSDRALRPFAIDLLTRRAENEPPARATLARLASDPDAQ